MSYINNHIIYDLYKVEICGKDISDIIIYYYFAFWGSNTVQSVYFTER